jgi:hypothetical protein
MICNLSKVEQNQLEAVKAAEKKLNKTLLALSCHDVSADALTEEELLTIKELERQTGLVIVAVKPPQG